MALQALDALSLQDRLPDRIVLTGLAGDEDEIDDARAHPLIAQDGVELVVRPPVPDPDQDPPLWAVIEDARTPLTAAPTHWIWILHDDTAPGPGAIAHLIEASRRSSGVGIVGPKLVRADDPRRLVSVGHRITRGGRDVDSQVARELDQGQHDKRVDVIGVPLPGMLVRSDVLASIGGVDKAFGDGTEGLDLSWRAHLAGHRVVVAPEAVALQGANGHHPPTLTTRRRTRQVALARGAWWTAPFRALGILLTSVLAGLGLLLVKRPTEAAGEFADTGAVLAPLRGLGARWRFRGRTRVRRGNLRSLFAPVSSGWAGTTDTMHGALTERGERRGASALETGPVSEDAESLESAPGRFRSLWSWPLALALLVALGAALTRWRDLWPALSGRGYGLTGGELGTVSAGWLDVWHAWADPWTGGGLGHGGEAPSWLLPMSGLIRGVEILPWVDPSRSPAAVTTAWLLWAALPLSVLSAYLAARVGVRSRWIRALAGLLWAGLAPLSAGIDEGRLGPVLAHVALPLIVAGVVVAGSRRHGVQRTTATCATVLLTALVGLFTPAVLLLVSLGGLLVLIFGPGWGRVRGLVLTLLPWLLTGPWLGRALEDPRIILGGAGTTVAGPPAVDPWQLALLHPGGGLSPMLWWTLPLIVLAVGAALRRGHRGRRATGLLVGALLGLAAALAAPLVQLGQVPAGYAEAGESITAWPGLFLSAAGACLLLAAAQAVELPPVGGRAPWHAPLVAVLTGVVAVAGLGSLAWTVWAGVGGQLAAAERPFPAVVEAQARGPEASRVLELRVEDDRVGYALSGREPNPWVRDRLAEVVTRQDAPERPDPAEEALTDAVLALASSGSAGDSSAAHETLLDLGVAFVGLRAGEEDPLVADLDATAALSRVTAIDGLMLWRVGAAGTQETLVSPARVRLVDEEGTPLAIVPVDGPRSTLGASGEPPASSAAVVFSEAAGWAEVAQVRVGGELIAPVEGEWPLRYAVTPDLADQVEVDLDHPDLTWRLGTLALAALLLFLALPLGSRRRSP